MIDNTIIDMHAHLYPEGCYTEIIKVRPEFSLLNSSRGLALVCRGSHTMSMPSGQEDLSSRLRIMDEAGVGIQVLSIGPLNVGWAGERDSITARRINDGLVAFCRQSPKRFRFVAALPCSSMISMMAELERALTLGTVGAGDHYDDGRLCARCGRTARLLARGSQTQASGSCSSHISAQRPGG